MTDIDAIRRKHEAQVAYTKEKQGNFPYLFQSIQSNLRISDVDALFAALDEARGKVEAYEPIVAAVESHLQRAMLILKGGLEDE